MNNARQQPMLMNNNGYTAPIFVQNPMGGLTRVNTVSMNNNNNSNMAVLNQE